MAAEDRAHFRIDVLGPFQAVSAEGVSRTPKGAKNQALLAMLALSPNMNRPRRWLEDKLWSTFGPEQASANLRQALSKLRTALGPDADLLCADRTTVWLEPTGIRVDLLEEVVPEDERTELLEGLDVRDPEFEDWLRQERAQLQAMVAKASPSENRGILINCRTVSMAPGHDQMMSDVLSNQIGETISEQVRAWRQADPDLIGANQAPPSDVLINSQLIADGDGYTLFLKAIHQPTARILYSKHQRIEHLGSILNSDEGVARTVFEASDQILGKLPHVLEKARPESRSTALSRLAMYRMFSFDQDALREAYGLMDQAYRNDENGLYLAWGSVIRMMQMMEMSEGNQDSLQEEAVALYYRAMERDADNGLVQALVSKVRGTAFGDKAGVLDLARTAVERNPSSAFAWKSLSEAYLLTDDVALAYETSSRARLIARSSPFKHWWDMGHCVTALAFDQFSEAISAGEATVRAAPLSRPAHRHLLALYAADGAYEKARAVAEKLKKIEPEFSIDRMVYDESYPVRTLRNKGLLEPLKALL